MPWPVYTERFLLVSEAGVWQHWPVPTNMRAVVKSISGVKPAGAAGGVVIAVHGVQVFTVDLQDQETAYDAAVTIVAYEQEWVQGYVSTPNMTLVICGFLFEDRSPDPHPPTDAVVLPMPPDPLGPTVPK